MNRYLLRSFMTLPWMAFFCSMFVLKDVAYPHILIINLVFLQALVINSRRKQVGMGATETSKALVPGIGYHAWRRLYFPKPQV